MSRSQGSADIRFALDLAVLERRGLTHPMKDVRTVVHIASDVRHLLEAGRASYLAIVEGSAVGGGAMGCV